MTLAAHDLEFHIYFEDYPPPATWWHDTELWHQRDPIATGHRFGKIPDQICDAMHWSKDEDIYLYRGRERERECIRARMHAYTSCNFAAWKYLRNLAYHPVELLDKKAIDSQTKHPAAGHQTHRAPQATLPHAGHQTAQSTLPHGRRPTADSTDNGIKGALAKRDALRESKMTTGKFSFVKLCVEKTTM